MKTYIPEINESKKKWYLVDTQDKALERTAVTNLPRLVQKLNYYII